MVGTGVEGCVGCGVGVGVGGTGVGVGEAFGVGVGVGVGTLSELLTEHPPAKFNVTR